MIEDDGLRPVDVALLRAIGRTGSVAAAARMVGISRDRAVYRLERLRAARGAPAVQARRGGSGHGGSRLTRGAAALLARAERSGRPRGEGLATRLQGTYVGGAQPRLRLADGAFLAVAFRGRPGAPVRVAVPAESVVLARRPFASSARNRLRAEVRRLERRGAGRWVVHLQAAGALWRVAVTPASVRSLRLAPGARVYLMVKATAIRRRPGPYSRMPSVVSE